MEKQPSGINGHQIMQMKSAMAADKFEKYIKETKFPKTPSELWQRLVTRAIGNTTPLYLRISLRDFQEVFTADLTDLSYFQFASLSNAIETISFDQTNLDKSEYMEVLDEALELIEFYGLEINRIRMKIEKEVDAEVAMKMAAERGAANMQAVKGEA